MDKDDASQWPIAVARFTVLGEAVSRLEFLDVPPKVPVPRFRALDRLQESTGLNLCGRAHHLHSGVEALAPQAEAFHICTLAGESCSTLISVFTKSAQERE